ncbi:MAG: hypothetical protein RDU25_00160 [Patescibacteria group bacterium]|nr:hypothetical protein [Patescibacteria group bacterium]
MGEEEKVPKPSTAPEGVDPLLWAFAGLAESGFGMPVTLQIGGALLTGRIISSKQYLEGLADGFAKANVLNEAGETQSEEVSRAMTESLVKGMSDLASKVGRMPYLHLTDATIRSPDGNTVRLQAAVWRGRLDAVAGFVLGIPSDD